MSQLTLINELDESTLPPLELPVWLLEGNTIFIGCRTGIIDDSGTWMWALCTSYYYSSREQQWKCDDTDIDDYNPTAWTYLPNVTDLLSQLNKEN
jgi:hypothetical protein